MLERKKLVRQVKAKNRISDIALCFKIAFDLIPQALIIHLIASAFSGRLSLGRIAFDTGAMLVCFVLKAACGYLAVWKAHEAAYNALTDLRMRIIEHLKKLPLGFFQERKTGELTNIVEHDVEQVEVYLAHGLPEITAALLLPVLIFAVMLFIEWRLALLMIAGIPLMGFTQFVSQPLWKKNFKIFAQSTKEMQENLMEYVANISVIKAFGKEERKTEKTIRSAKDYVYWVKKSMTGISVPMGLIDFFMESGVVLVMVFGTRLLASGSLSAARFILSVILGAAFTASVAKTATFQHYGVVFNQA
ncbi:MAG: ABC transporter transmembrane domain-containing protein, partial [Treponema socranskii subsp. buccale]